VPAVSDGALAGRKILITGGSTGLGAALAGLCTQAGAAVGIVARSAERLAEVADATGAVAVPVDISDFDAATAAVEEIAGRLGGIDTLVNNAGVMLHSPVGAGFAEDWQRIFDINVIGTLHVTRAALPYLRAAPRGDLLMVASTSADKVTAPDYGVYAATKAAQARLVDGLRLELADAPHVRVVLVKPGFMNTPGLGPGTRNPELQQNVVALKEKIGLPPVRVAEQLLHVLAVPPEVTITELTIMPTAKA